MVNRTGAASSPSQDKGDRVCQPGGWEELELELEPAVPVEPGRAGIAVGAYETKKESTSLEAGSD